MPSTHRLYLDDDPSGPECPNVYLGNCQVLEARNFGEDDNAVWCTHRVILPQGQHWTNNKLYALSAGFTARCTHSYDCCARWYASASVRKISKRQAVLRITYRQNI